MIIQKAAKTFIPFKQSIESSALKDEDEEEEEVKRFIKFSRIEKAIKYFLLTLVVFAWKKKKKIAV